MKPSLLLLSFRAIYFGWGGCSYFMAHAGTNSTNGVARFRLLRQSKDFVFSPLLNRRRHPLSESSLLIGGGKMTKIPRGHRNGWAICFQGCQRAIYSLPDELGPVKISIRPNYSLDGKSSYTPKQHGFDSSRQRAGIMLNALLSKSATFGPPE